MIALLILLGLSAASGVEYKDLRARFDWSADDVDTKSFFQIPRTIEQAEKQGWLETQRAPGPLEELLLYCWPEYYVCGLYHPCGFIAGLQVAFPAADLYTAAFKREKWFKNWTIPATDDEPAKEYIYISQYYVPEDYAEIDDGPTEEYGETLQYGGIWIESPDTGKLMRMPTTEQEILDAHYTKQNCIPNMGTHYHYKMNNETLCENQLPWFALVLNDSLIASGMQFFGDIANQPKGRNWFEKFSGREAEKSGVPLGPDCLYDFADAHPIFSFHIYYCENPWTIRCRPEDSAAAVDVLKLIDSNKQRYSSTLYSNLQKLFAENDADTQTA